MRTHGFDEFDRIFGERFAVDGGNETPDDAVAAFAFAQPFDDRALGGFVAHRVLETGPVPEEFDVAHAVRGGRFEVLERDALEHRGLREDVRFKRAEDAKNAHGLFAAREEFVDLRLRHGRVRFAHEVFERFLADRAEEVAVQLGLGEGFEEFEPFGRQTALEGTVGNEPGIGGTHESSVLKES